MTKRRGTMAIPISLNRHPPGQKKSNELGLYDMSGNAAEWCIDVYQEEAVMEPTHNPGRVDKQTREYMADKYRLQKGGYVEGYATDFPLDKDDIIFYTTRKRLPANLFWGLPDEARPENRYGTIRLVRNGE